jgi:mannose-6-phosphate isomerase
VETASSWITRAEAVADGRFAGQSLRDLFQRYAPAILGLQWSPEVKRFPLLYKFIHAREKLSVQVHPGKYSPEGEPKTECWTLLEAPEKAGLILGLKPGDRNRQELIETLQGSDCEKVLNRVPCTAGDVFFIPAGTVHAITEGLLLYEVQQNSDTTYRLYDWGRVDDQGQPRELHVQEAAEVMEVESVGQGAIPPLRVEKSTHVEEYLVACPEFALIRLKELSARARIDIPHRFRVLSVMSGVFMLHPDNGPSLRLERGGTVLLPAS